MYRSIWLFFCYYVSMIRLVASDCDGTILNDDSELDEQTVSAIRRFQEAGGIFMLATGRNRWDAKVIADQIGRCVLNCDNGCALFDENGKELLIHEIGKEKIRAMSSLSYHYDFPVLYHGIEGTYITFEYERFKERAIAQIVRVYSPMLGEEIFNWIFENENFHYGSNIDEIINKTIIKLEPVFIDDEEYKTVRDECEKIFRDTNIYFGTFLNNVEINSIESDKGKAIKDYCRLMGISDDEVAVIGDSVNDVSMFRQFKNSYCVKSGQEMAKKAAGSIIDGNNDLGVAKLLNKINNDKNV